MCPLSRLQRSHMWLRVICPRFLLVRGHHCPSSLSPKGLPSEMKTKAPFYFDHFLFWLQQSEILPLGSCWAWESAGLVSSSLCFAQSWKKLWTSSHSLFYTRGNDGAGMVKCLPSASQLADDETAASISWLFFMVQKVSLCPAYYFSCF